MRVISVCAACVMGAVVALASPVAAKPLQRDHYSFRVEDHFTNTDCGSPIEIDYVNEGSGLFKVMPGRAGDPATYFFNNYSSVETFTNVANGKTATIVSQGLFKDLHNETIQGTIVQITAIETGRPVVVIGPAGKKLVFDRGRIRYTFLIDTLGDADPFNDVFLGDVIDPDVAGPHPIFFEGADFCALLNVLR